MDCLNGILSRKFVKSIGIVVAFLLSGASCASAATYYVSVSGSDTTGNGSAGNPWATIQRAVNAAGAGDTVLVNDGTYAGFHSVNGGAVSNPVIIRANGSNVVINSRNINTIDNINIENTDYVTVDGFRSINSQRCGIRVAVSRGVVVRNNVCANATWWGIFTAFAPEVNIDSNTCYGTVQQHGIYVSNSDVPNDNPVIRGNRCYSNNWNGIQLNGDLESGGDGNIEGALVENNICHDNNFKGFSIISVTSSTIRNNISYDNGLSGGAGGIHLAQQPGTGVLCEYDVIANNTVDEPRVACIRITDGTTNTVFNNVCVGGTGVVDEAGGNSIDPASNLDRTADTGLFVNPSAGDYRLATGSPAIDAGTASFAGNDAPMTDILGSIRPFGSKYDAGAFEYSPGAPTTFFIRGHILTAGGAGIPGATVTLSGSVSQSVVTPVSGLYLFAGLAPGGNYTVAPALNGYTFAPLSRSTAPLSGNWDNRDFTGNTVTPPSAVYTISGYVRDTGGAGVGGVSLALSGGLSRSAATGADGSYQFTSLPAGSYTVTPSKSGYTFIPTKRSAANLSGDAGSWDFTAAASSQNQGADIGLRPGEIKIIGPGTSRGVINPDAGETAKIYFRGSSAGVYEARVFTLSGELVWKSVQENVSEGMFEWVPKDVSSGGYVVLVQGPGLNMKKKVAIVR